MTIFKCKMCGGTLEINNNESVVECEYCGTQQTLPKLNDERKMNLYDRANHFRRNNEFDKAEGIYEQILNEDNTDAEAYWSLVLCRYGIEYVEDPTTHKRVPTVNRAQFTSVFDDDNYKSALQYADLSQKVIYEKEAQEINEIQKGILAISQKEDPFDVFICYKETDNSGRRTPDSVLANDLYHQLTQEGFKVFFSRITLEDKLGSAYEPYIFAALNSAKVMVVLGTKPEFFKAVWVRNEWSRYLALIKQGQKKMLIPAYKDMDPYDLPEEFSHLQAQDMSRLGFMQDLIRGIKKITDVEVPKTVVVKEEVISENTSNVDILLKRVFIFLEDKDWDSANTYCEKVLDVNPECALAYLGKIMAEFRVSKKEKLQELSKPFDQNYNYLRILRYGEPQLIQELKEYIRIITEKVESDRVERIYQNACNLMSNNQQAMVLKASELFRSIIDYKDSLQKREECEKKAVAIFNNNLYNEAIDCMKMNDVESYENAIEKLEQISLWRNSSELISQCKNTIAEINFKKEQERLEEVRRAEDERLERERQEEVARQENVRIAKRNRKIAAIVTPIVSAVVFFIIVLNVVIIPRNAYDDAKAFLKNQKYNEALAKFVIAKNVEGANEYIKNIMLLQRQNGTEYISVDGFQTIGLKLDGTVVATEITEYKWDEGQCDVSEWKDIVAISTGGDHTVGLKSDGTVIATEITDSTQDEGQCDVSEWSDIVAISAGEFHTVGLKSDGTVVATKFISDTWDYGQCDVSGWTDIVAISAGYSHTVGLKSDGTVVATKYTGDMKYYDGKCDVSEWTDIVAITAGDSHTVGLKSDGTVVIAGDEEIDISGWTDIVAIAAGAGHTVGLKSDGTVVAVKGDDVYEGSQCDVSGWRDIVAISAGSHNTVGLKVDGSVIAVGEGSSGSCNVQDWNLFQ